MLSSIYVNLTVQICYQKTAVHDWPLYFILFSDIIFSRHHQVTARLTPMIWKNISLRSSIKASLVDCFITSDFVMSTPIYCTLLPEQPYSRSSVREPRTRYLRLHEIASKLPWNLFVWSTKRLVWIRPFKGTWWSNVVWILIVSLLNRVLPGVLYLVFWQTKSYIHIFKLSQPSFFEKKASSLSSRCTGDPSGSYMPGVFTSDWDITPEGSSHSVILDIVKMFNSHVRNESGNNSVQRWLRWT